MTIQHLYKILLTVLPLLVTATTKAQIPPTPDRSIVETEMVTDDSTVVAHIYKGNRSVKTQYPLFYHWYNKGFFGTTQDGYSGNLLHGMYCVYDKKNRLIRSGNYEYGLQNGIWKSWYPNGTLRYSQSWKKGKPEGPWLYYQSDGRLQRSLNYHSGLLSGQSVEYTGDTCVIKSYKKGVEVTSGKGFKMLHKRRSKLEDRQIHGNEDNTNH